eukprot:ANDGO_04663.mRNA.1 hypothetical protein
MFGHKHKSDTHNPFAKTADTSATPSAVDGLPQATALIGRQELEADKPSEVRLLKESIPSKILKKEELVPQHQIIHKEVIPERVVLKEEIVPGTVHEHVEIVPGASLSQTDRVAGSTIVYGQPSRQFVESDQTGNIQRLQQPTESAMQAPISSRVLMETIPDHTVSHTEIVPEHEKVVRQITPEHAILKQEVYAPKVVEKAEVVQSNSLGSHQQLPGESIVFGKDQNPKFALAAEKASRVYDAPAAKAIPVNDNEVRSVEQGMSDVHLQTKAAAPLQSSDMPLQQAYVQPGFAAPSSTIGVGSYGGKSDVAATQESKLRGTSDKAKLAAEADAKHTKMPLHAHSPGRKA